MARVPKVARAEIFGDTVFEAFPQISNFEIQITAVGIRMFFYEGLYCNTIVKPPLK